MRIQFASDLHLELLERDAPGARLVVPAPGADLLVLAGDIHNGTRGIEAFADWPVPVVNPAGYVLNRGAAAEGRGSEFENGRFDPALVVEVDAEVRA